MSSDADTIIRYDGPALAGHEIDVQELAPALLALAEMVQLTNRRFNGESAVMKVTVRADVEQQCFMLHIHIVQSILEAARHLFGTEEYKTAKEIAEMLDLISPVGIPGGVFALWKWRAKQKREADPSGSSVVINQHGGTTVINNFYASGAALTVPTEVYELSNDPSMIDLGKRVMAPLQREGYDTLGFFSRDKPVVEIDKAEATAFRCYVPDNIPMEPVPEDDAVHTPIKGRVSIITRSDIGEAKWRLKWTGQAAPVTMPPEWLAEYQAGRVDIPVGSLLDVTIEMVTSRTDPNASPNYKVLEVHGVIPPAPSTQMDMLNDKPS